MCGTWLYTGCFTEAGNMTRAAARLGLERSHLYKKLRQLGMRAEE